MSNKVKHPEAWAFYEEQARNMEEEPEAKFGKYRIPIPNMSGDFIYAPTVEQLWVRFIVSWYKVDHNSLSVYGKIQYIVQHLNH